jgi:hypothetical protein
MTFILCLDDSKNTKYISSILTSDSVKKSHVGGTWYIQYLFIKTIDGSSMLELRRDDLQLFLFHYSLFVSILYCYISAILNLKSTHMLVTYNVKIPQNSMNSGTIFKWGIVTRTRQVVKHGVEFGVFSMLELRRDDLQLFLFHYSLFVSILYCYISAILKRSSLLSSNIDDP